MEPAGTPCEPRSSPALLQVLTRSRLTAVRLKSLLESTERRIRWSTFSASTSHWDREEAPDAVIYEVRRGDRRVLQFLQQLAADGCDACVIVIGPDQPADVVAQLLRSGAFDYLTMPVNRTRLLESLRQGLEIRQSFQRVQHLSEQLAGINRELAGERDELQRWNRQLATLNRLSQKLAASLNVEQAHHALEMGLRGLLPFDMAGVVWRKPERAWLIASGAGLFERDDKEEQRLHARTNRLVESFDILAERTVRPQRERRGGRDIALLEYPLVVRQTVQGLLYVERRDGHRFDEMECELVASLATSLALALHNADSYQAVQELATVDGLTGLRNRRAFNETVEREFNESRRYNTQACLLMVDLDHFKRINDRFGHPAGDTVLQGVGAILGKLARSVDVVARYGGEEFGIVLPHTSLEQACSLASRIRQQLAHRPFTFGGAEVRMTVSIGIAALPHGAIASPNAWVGAADEALYAAKRQGRDRIIVHGAITGDPSSHLIAA